MNVFVLTASLLLAVSSTRTVDLKVGEGGFEPAQVHVKKGEPLKLVFTRTTDETCAKKLVIKDANVRKDLPLNKAVTVEFTPSKTGEIHYACGMDMVSGVLLVE